MNWIDAARHGDESFAASRYEEALAFYAQAVAMNPGEAGTMSSLRNAEWMRARTLAALGRAGEARRVVADLGEEAISPQERLAAAEILLATGSRDDAISAYRRTLEHAREARRALRREIRRADGADDLVARLRQALADVEQVATTAAQALTDLGS